MGYSLMVSSMSPVHEDTEGRVNMPSFLVIKIDSYIHLVFLCKILEKRSHDNEIKKSIHHPRSNAIPLDQYILFIIFLTGFSCHVNICFLRTFLQLSF